MDERDTAINMLRRMADAPGMYGLPESVLSAAKDLVHIVKLTQDSNQPYKDTEAFLARCWAVDSLDMTCIRQDHQLHEAARFAKWGDRQDLAERQVLSAYRRWWRFLRPQCHDCPTTAGWLDRVLVEPNHWQYPDEMAATLWCLLSLATVGKRYDFRILYEYELWRMGNYGPSRRLEDVGPKRAWIIRLSNRPNDFPSYPCVSRLLSRIIRELE